MFEILKKLNNKQVNVKDDKKKNDIIDYLCCGCCQTMVEPRNPFILFPCGHNICRLCLFGDDKGREKSRNMRIKECKKCGVKITNCAENRSLMNII